MGSIIEINDTLQLTREQGFPSELDFKKHQVHTLLADDFAGREFRFTGKPGKRIYQDPPIRNFLVENINGKWLYWGLVYVWDVVYDHITKTTSGKFKIIYIYTPEEMKLAHQLIDRNPKTDYF